MIKIVITKQDIEKQTVVFPLEDFIIPYGAINENLQHQEVNCQFQLEYDAEIFELLIDSEELSAVVYDDNEAVFTGTIRRDLTWTDNGYPLPMDNVTLTIEDNTKLFKKTTENEVAFINKTIEYIINTVCLNCGVTIAAGQTLKQTNVEAFVLDAGTSYLEKFNSLLFQYGYTYIFNGQGEFVAIDINSQPASLVSINEGEFFAGLQIQRNNKNYTGIKLTYNNLIKKEKEQVFWQGNGLNNENKVIPITVLPNQYYPYESNPIIEADEGQVYQTFENGYAESYELYNGEKKFRRTNKTSLVYTENHEIVRDWDGELIINRTDFGAKQASVRFLNQSKTDVSLYQFAIRADAYYRSDDVYLNYGDTSDPYEYQSEYIYNATVAQSFAEFLSRFFMGRGFKISGKVASALAVGTHVNIDTGVSGFICSAVVTAVEYDCKEEKYKLTFASYGQTAVLASRYKHFAANYGNFAFTQVVEKNISSLTKEYYLSSEAESVTGGVWSETPFIWKRGTYVWTRTKTLYNSGETVYTKPQRDETLEISNVKSIKTEYSSSSSPEMAPIDGWSINRPEWQEGKYIWVRFIITYENEETDISEASCIKGNTGASGKDGLSPTITTSKSGRTTTITIKDASGTKTATITDGSDGISLENRGNWAASTAYKINEYVYYTTDKTSYVCKKAHTSSSSILPTNTTYWSVLATSGSDGKDGVDGKNGTDGKNATQYYIHYVYCDNTSTGANYSTSESKTYIGTYTDTTQADASTFAIAKAKAGIVWSKITGTDGKNGVDGKNGIDGKDGTDALVIDLTNEFTSIPMDKDGAVLADTSVSTTAVIYSGATAQTITANVTYSKLPSGITVTSVNKGVITFKVAKGAKLTSDKEDITITATCAKGTLSSVLTIQGLRQGNTGDSAVIYSIYLSDSVIKLDKDGNYSASSLICVKNKTVGGDTVETDEGKISMCIDGGDWVDYKQIDLATAKPKKSIQFVYAVNNVKVDAETVAIVEDGADGEPGATVRNQILRGTLLGYGINSSSSWTEGRWRNASATDSSTTVTRSVVDITDCPDPNIKKAFKIELKSVISGDVVQNNVPVIVGQVYTMSCWVKGKGTLIFQYGKNPYPVEKININSENVWIKKSFTFTAPDTSGVIKEGLTNIYFGNRGVGVMYIAGMKLELGDTATDWCEYEEDKNGKSVKAVTNVYQRTNSSTAPALPTSIDSLGSWKKDVEQVSLTAQYLWSCEIVTYTNASDTVTPATLIAQWKNDGKSMTGIKNAYKLGNSATLPSKPDETDAFWEQSNAGTSSAWGTVCPATSQTNRYIYNCERIEYTDADSVKTYLVTDVAIASIEGTNGTSGYIAEISSNTLSVPTDTSLKPQSATATTFDVYCYKHGQQMTAVTGTPEEGQFKITLGTAPTGITQGTPTASGTKASFTLKPTATSTAIGASGTVTVTVTYYNSEKKATETVTKTISVTANKQGTRGSLEFSGTEIYRTLNGENTEIITTASIGITSTDMDILVGDTYVNPLTQDVWKCTTAGKPCTVAADGTVSKGTAKWTWQERRLSDVDTNNCMRFFSPSTPYNLTSTNYTASVVTGENPFGENDLLLKVSKPDGTNIAGRIVPYYQSMKIDTSKTYRYVCYIKQATTNTGNTDYFGIRGYTNGGDAYIQRLAGESVISAYFTSATKLGTTGKWYLVIGYVVANNKTTAPSDSGVYDIETGKKVKDCTNFRWKNLGVTNMLHTGTLIGYTASATTVAIEKYVYDMRFDIVDGNEPTIDDLLHRDTSNNIIYYDDLTYNVDYVVGYTADWANANQKVVTKGDVLTINVTRDDGLKGVMYLKANESSNKAMMSTSMTINATIINIVWNGEDGSSVTIKSTSITYKASESGTTAPTSGWSESVPFVTKGQFLWTKTTVEYSDGKSTNSYAVAYIGTNGTSVSISSTSIEYAASESGTTAPTTGWSTTIPSVSEGDFLWSKTTVNYSNSKSTTSYAVSYMGIDGEGEDGLNTWYSSASASSSTTSIAKNTITTPDGFEIKVGDLVIVNSLIFYITAVGTNLTVTYKQSIKGDTGVTPKCSVQSIKINQRRNGTLDFDSQTFTCQLYKGSTLLTPSGTPTVTTSGTKGGVTATIATTSGTSTVTVKAGSGSALCKDLVLTVSMVYDSVTYTFKVPVMAVVMGSYKGGTETLPTANAAAQGDFYCYTGSSSSYTLGGVYTCYRTAASTYAWTLDTSKDANMVALSDAANISALTGSEQAEAFKIIRTLVTNQIFAEAISGAEILFKKWVASIQSDNLHPGDLLINMGNNPRNTDENYDYEFALRQYMGEFDGTEKWLDLFSVQKDKSTLGSSQMYVNGSIQTNALEVSGDTYITDGEVEVIGNCNVSRSTTFFVLYFDSKYWCILAREQMGMFVELVDDAHEISKITYSTYTNIAVNIYDACVFNQYIILATSGGLYKLNKTGNQLNLSKIKDGAYGRLLVMGDTLIASNGSISTAKICMTTNLSTFTELNYTFVDMDKSDDDFWYAHKGGGEYNDSTLVKLNKNGVVVGSVDLLNKPIYRDGSAVSTISIVKAFTCVNNIFFCSVNESINNASWLVVSVDGGGTFNYIRVESGANLQNQQLRSYSIGGSIIIQDYQRKTFITEDFVNYKEIRQPEGTAGFSQNSWSLAPVEINDEDDKGFYVGGASLTDTYWLFVIHKRKFKQGNSADVTNAIWMTATYYYNSSSTANESSLTKTARKIISYESGQKHTTYIIKVVSDTNNWYHGKTNYLRFTGLSGLNGIHYISATMEGSNGEGFEYGVTINGDSAFNVNIYNRNASTNWTKPTFVIKVDVYE